MTDSAFEKFSSDMRVSDEDLRRIKDEMANKGQDVIQLKKAVRCAVKELFQKTMS